MACFFSLAVFALALWSPAIFNDGDTYWHVRAGEWMLAHGTVLDHDVFSLPFSGRPWITQEWLSEVLLAVAYALAGWSGVAILTGLSAAAAVMLLGLFLGRRLDPLPGLVVLVLSVSCWMPDYLARPHILALPWMTMWLIGITTAAASHRRPSWQLLPIMTIWANLHGGFVFGIALLIPVACEAVFDSEERRARLALQWAIFAAAAVAAALVNPHGFRGLIYPFELMQNQSLAAVGEWQALDLHRFNAVEVAALVGGFFFIWRGIRVQPVRLLLLIALFHQSLVHARYGMILGLTAAVLLADPLAAALRHERSSWNALRTRTLPFAMGAVVFLLCAAVRIHDPITRTEGPAWPANAIAAIPASLAAEPVFNNYAFGGFLIFSGIKPLVDSRADFYGDAYLAEYWNTVSGEKSAVERTFRRYGVKWTILEPGDPLVGVLDRRAGWHRLFTDSFAVIQAAPDFTSTAQNLTRGVGQRAVSSRTIRQ
jgi:hypothetical protein